MKAILFVGHGSKDPEGNEELAQFAKRMTKGLKTDIIEICFLEFAEPDLPQGIERCVARGAQKIVVVPMMLFAAGHAKVHIPMAILQAKRRFPEVTFQYKRAIEVEERVLPILKQRLASFQTKIGVETAIVLVGRGSRAREANSDLLKIARLLWEEIPVHWVEVAFMGVTEPLFHEGMERCIKLGAKNIIVLPYFLFTGILIKRMQRFTEEWQKNYPERWIEQAPYLGIDDELISVFQSRLDEEVSKSWTWESLSRQALEQGIDHHHHHHHHHQHES